MYKHSLAYFTILGFSYATYIKTKVYNEKIYLELRDLKKEVKNIKSN
jgi:hypothetical protein